MMKQIIFRRTFATFPVAQKFTDTVGHPYHRLFECAKSETDLARHLSKNILYNRHGLVAISKPWNVGVHKARLLIDEKNPGYTQQALHSQIFGEPKYCIADSLPFLSQILGTPPLRVVKATDRKFSGLILLSSDQRTEILIQKSVTRAKTERLPFMQFYCIVNGTIPSAVIGKAYTERCGIRLIEIEEFGKLKEPVYIPPEQMSKNMRKFGTNRKWELGSVKTATVCYRVVSRNPELAVSLVEIATTVVKWSLIQCFLAYKASFVLGDTMFSHRVKHILGQPITMSALKKTKVENLRHLDPRFEPLSTQVRRALSVQSNRQIPLMIHHHGLHLPGLLRKLQPKNCDGDDLIIADSVEKFPEHFLFTMERLGLSIPEEDKSESTIE